MGGSAYNGTLRSTIPKRLAAAMTATQLQPQEVFSAGGVVAASLERSLASDA